MLGNIEPLIWQWMLENIFTNEKVTSSNKSMFLQKDSGNTIHPTCGKWRSMSENGNKNSFVTWEKKTGEISRAHQYSKDRLKLLVTWLSSLSMFKRYNKNIQYI